MSQGSGKVSFIGEDHSEQLLGVGLRVLGVHGERFEGAGFGNVLLIQLIVSQRMVIPDLRRAARAEF